MSIKLISFDMDGTIYNNGYISDKTKEAFEKLRAKNIRLVPNTGRSIHSVERIMKELGFDIDGYEAILTTGSVVQKLGSREIVKENFLTESDYNYLKTLDRKNLNLTVYGADFLYYTFKNKEFISDSTDLEAPIIQIDDNTKFEQICRINFMGEPKDLDEFEEKYKEEISKRYYYVRQIPTSLEILSKKSNKGNGLKYIMNKYNIQRDEVLAIGDGNNDISMFEVCDYSVAMGNSSQKVKEKAKYITDSIKDEGFYNILNKLKIISK